MEERDRKKETAGLDNECRRVIIPAAAEGGKEKKKNNNRASVRWNYTNKFPSCNDIIFLVVVVVYAPGSIKYAASFLFLYKKMIYLYDLFE